MHISNNRLCARLSHWFSGFLFHIVISVTALAVAIHDWNKSCEDDSNLQITGSAWLITSEAILILYATLLIPTFLFWEVHHRRTHYSIAIDIYTGLIIAFFSVFLICWNLLGIFLLFGEIEDCNSSGMWIMSIISLVRSWVHFVYPLSIIIVREIEEHLPTAST